MRIAFNNMKMNQEFSTKAASARRSVLFSALFVCLAALWPLHVSAQWAFAPPTTPDAQRNALNAVRSQVNWLENNTRTASNFAPEQGYGSLRREFDGLRLAYVEFLQTLTPEQLDRGANSLGELYEGLDIMDGAFANYEDDIAGGKTAGVALNNMCRVLRQSSDLWLKDLDKTASQLRVGWRS